MYNKKQLIATAVCTAIVVCILNYVFFVQLGGYPSGDMVTRARRIIEENYVNPLTDEQRTKMNDTAIAGMVYSLGDQYSSYLNTEALEAYEEDKKESYVGIGVSVNFDSENNVMTVVSPYDGSPAQTAGILPQDVIKKVNGVTVTADTYDSVIEDIKNGEGDSVELAILRGGEERVFTVKREEVKRQSVTHKMFADRIGYVRISEFIHNTADDFEAALSDLKERGMQALIIDLRSNPGGYADSVLKMTDSLLPKGVIAYLEDNKGQRQYFNSDDNCLDMPMAVLINQGTASASELMAGSLKAHGLATVIGEKSYGKAVGQSLYPLTSKTAIYLTNARYFTPNGECIDKVGIEPDIKVSLAEDLIGKISVLEPEQDAQLSKALEVLKGKLGE